MEQPVEPEPPAKLIPPEALVAAPPMLRVTALLLNNVAVPVELVVRLPLVVAKSDAAVTKPAWLTVKLVAFIRLPPKVPEKVKPLVMLLAVPAVILMASVAVIWLPVASSLLAILMMEATVLSAGEPALALIAKLATVSLTLPATVAAWLYWTSKPAM